MLFHLLRKLHFLTSRANDSKRTQNDLKFWSSSICSWLDVPLPNHRALRFDCRFFKYLAFILRSICNWLDVPLSNLHFLSIQLWLSLWLSFFNHWAFHLAIDWTFLYQTFIFEALSVDFANCFQTFIFGALSVDLFDLHFMSWILWFLIVKLTTIK